MPGPPPAADGTVLAVVGTLAALVIAAIAYFVMNQVKADAGAAPPAAAPADGTGATRKKKARKGGLAAMRARRRADQAAGGAAGGVGDDDGEADGAPDGIDFVPMDAADDADDNEPDTSKMGTKKLAKLAAKEEKRAAREAAVREREDAKKRQELRWAEEAKARAEAEEAERLDEERKEAEEADRKRKEEEEYQAMKAMFTVDESGTMADDADESQALLEEFVAYVKQTKVVLLEELAARFKLKTSDAIARLQALEEEGRLTGVMDDRGKFIYVSEDEMAAVVKFVRQRGRVTISELAENSASLISLEGVAAQS